MPHVSRHKLTKKTEEDLIRHLTTAFSGIRKPEEMSEFFAAILTPVERVMMAKRLAIVVMIEEGLTDTEIANALHLTRITVAKMRYFYEARGQGFRIALKKLEEQQQLESFKAMLTSLLRYSVRAAGGRL